MDFFSTAFGKPLELLFNPLKAWDEFKNGRNYEVSQNNLQFQRENLDYEKALQKEIFEREDTAYQRTINDMRQAGMNPLAMQGTNGAGEAIATEPMNNNFQDTSNLSALSQIFNTINQISTTKNNATLSNAQANLVNAQADSAKIEAKYKEAQLLKTLENLNLDSIGKRFQNERSNIAWLNDFNNYAFNRQFGISDNMPEWFKALNIGTHQGKMSDSWFNEFNNRSWNDNSFGRSFNELGKPNFNNLESILDNTNLKGALMENELGKILLRLLGIGK